MERPLTWMIGFFSSPARPTSCSTLRTKPSDLQTAMVSRKRSIFSAMVKPGQSDRVPLTLSSTTFWNPAFVRASRCNSRFWSCVETRAYHSPLTCFELGFRDYLMKRLQNLFPVCVVNQ